LSIELIDRISATDRRWLLTACAAFAIVVAVADQLNGGDVSLGLLYLLPLAVSAALVDRKVALVLGAVAAVAREQLGPNAWNAEAAPRMLTSLAAFMGVGLFISEVTRNRRLLLEHVLEIEHRAYTKSEAESESRALLEGSPVAVLSVDAEGRIRGANDAARRLLGFDTGSPEGELVHPYLPVLARLVSSRRIGHMLRTMIEASGSRRTGESFVANLWVSTYQTSNGSMFAAMVTDATEQLRDREESGLRQLLMSSRIIASAVSHEVRNLSAAANVLHSNVGKCPGVRQTEDYRALGTTIETLRKLATADLTESVQHALEGIDISSLLDQLKIILKPGFEECGTELEWEIADRLPRVRADRSGLLQVFINLAQNSARALNGVPGARLTIVVYRLSDLVILRFADNGPGVPNADRLFQPFQPGAEASGLGLYVSRAMIRTFGGELHHIQRAGETYFVVELPAVTTADEAAANA
jgi:two-component system, LuxR family, sensor kinase FixL